MLFDDWDEDESTTFKFADSNLKLPLIEAIFDNNIKLLEQILDQGANINLQDNEDNTPLHKAIDFKRWEAFKFLIQRPEICLNVQNVYGVTPLLFSTICNLDSYAEELLKAGADASIADFEGDTVLHHLTNKTLIELALQSGADINALDAFDWTPLQHVCYTTNEELAYMLLYFGADPNIGHYDSHPLSLALRHKNTHLADILYNYTFFPDTVSCSLDLVFAALVARSHLFRPILEQIIDIDQSNNEDFSNIIVTSDPEDFKLLFKKFPKLVESIGSEIVEKFLYDCAVTRNFNQNSANLKLLLESDELIQNLALKLQHETFKFTLLLTESHRLFWYFMMSLGVPVLDRDMRIIRKVLGRPSEVYTILQHMEIKRTGDISVCEAHHLLDTNVHTKRTDLLSTICPFGNINLHQYFSFPEFKYNYREFDNQVMTREIWDLREYIPVMPTLVESSRDSARQHIINTYSIKSYGMFLSIVKSLPIDPLRKRQLTYHQPLYYYNI